MKEALHSDGADIPRPGAEVRDDLWSAYRASRASDLHDELVTHYLPFTRGVARRIYRLHAAEGVPFDDYLQYARVGLLESIDRFDVERGVPFSSFAFHRIRGAILNGLTQESELAAQRETSRRVARERRESMLAESLQNPSTATLEQLVELTMSLALGALLEDAAELPDDSVASNPYASVEVQQLRRALRSAVTRLPEREAELIAAHYFEQREFLELAERWGVTKGRVSQLHSRAIRLLREQLTGAPPINRRV